MVIRRIRWNLGRKINERDWRTDCGSPQEPHFGWPLFDVGVALRGLTERGIFERDVAVEQTEVDFGVFKGAVDHERVFHASPHAAPLVVDDVAAVEDDKLRSVVGIFGVRVLVVEVFAREPHRDVTTIRDTILVE